MKPCILLAVVFLAVGLVVAGCSSVRTIGPSSNLHSLVGHSVRFEGRFDGPGKEADYVVISDQAVFPNGVIYLIGKPDFGGREVSYGSTITVEGKLRYAIEDEPRPEEKKNEDSIQHAGNFFFIENAKVRLIQQLSVTPK
jgi:hypothetical protein